MVKPERGLSVFLLCLLLFVGSSQGLTKKDFKGKNVVLFITDQERAIQHFPEGWAEANLPGLSRLRKNGLTFTRAFTNACMCTPARTTLLTGYLPAQTGAHYTLEADMPAERYPQVEMPTPDQLPNIATTMSATHDFVYKGKMHISKAAKGGSDWAPSDAAKYGFNRWNCPDAGANQAYGEAGGPPAYNDARFMNSTGAAGECDEGVIDYLKKVAKNPGKKPFFMVVSLVNPHDVLFFPDKFNDTYNDPGMLEGSIRLPKTWTENISYPHKPAAQAKTLQNFIGMGMLTPDNKKKYLNFYGNLIRSSDKHLVEVLDTLTSLKLLDDTVVIKLSDHGEMGIAHGGLRQKNFVAYEEATRVPLIYSNPKLYPKPVTSDALVSHVDFVPTLANLFSVPASKKQSNWAGKDYSSIIVNHKARPVQDYVIFTFNDFESGQKSPPYVATTVPNCHILSIREKRWKLTKYFDPAAQISEVPPQWEMYDLDNDPLERENLASPIYKRNAAQEKEFQRLAKKLEVVQAKRLAPLPLRRTIKLNATTAAVILTPKKVKDVGKINGIPVGQGKIALEWTLNQKAKTSTVSFFIQAQQGIIYGKGDTKFVIEDGKIKHNGKASFTSGTGVYSGIKATGLTLIDSGFLNGTGGRVDIYGSAFY